MLSRRQEWVQVLQKNVVTSPYKQLIELKKKRAAEEERKAKAKKRPVLQPPRKRRADDRKSLMFVWYM